VRESHRPAETNKRTQHARNLRGGEGMLIVNELVERRLVWKTSATV